MGQNESFWPKFRNFLNLVNSKIEPKISIFQKIGKFSNFLLCQPYGLGPRAASGVAYEKRIGSLRSSIWGLWMQVLGASRNFQENLEWEFSVKIGWNRSFWPKMSQNQRFLGICLVPGQGQKWSFLKKMAILVDSFFKNWWFLLLFRSSFLKLDAVRVSILKGFKIEIFDSISTKSDKVRFGRKWSNSDSQELGRPCGELVRPAANATGLLAATGPGSSRFARHEKRLDSANASSSRVKCAFWAFCLVPGQGQKWSFLKKNDHFSR